MKQGLIGAWLVAEGIVTWRQVHGTGKPPSPGRLAAVTGLFVALAITGGVFPRAAGVITVGAWGLDIAGILNLWPAGLGGQIQQTAASGSTAPGTGGLSGSGGANPGPAAGGAAAI